ncbi:ABC transporter ATP-binding protein [Paenibacillus harenae]|uniref:ABC-2 type transport system ATP-binding protein n=1 Tax=Paenibacillus harenae TaxID=306543 RepID=A0ABT9UBP5_PAEHA|nr:ABC transporter ATP-binding protein [Paenibacillus harenae]MDQ0115629.1 ABC-2 type transport system ATP-binding protein [Paenibacillus harenae]
MTVLLEAEGLTKTFGSFKAVTSMSFAIQESHCVALLGPNGAGKTTTIRMLAGLLAPTNGRIGFQGVREGGSHCERIGYLPQSPSFYNWMTGYEYTVYAGRLCGLATSEAKAAATKLLERVGLANAAGKKIGSYSGGMKQRLGLAQALIHRPKLLIMDEPVSALDPVGRRDVLSLLRELKQETTVLFSTHVLHDAEALCDDVIIIREGQIALQGGIAAIQDENRKPVIELTVDSDAHSQAWLAGMKARMRREGEASTSSPDSLAALIKHIEISANHARLQVSEVHAARQMLLEELASEKIGLLDMKVGHSSLEDLFMKVVSE